MGNIKDIVMSIPYLGEPSARLYWGYLLASLAIAIFYSIILNRSGKHAKALLNKDFWFSPSSLLDIRIFIVNGLFKAFILAAFLPTTFTVMTLYMKIAPNLETPLKSLGTSWQMLTFTIVAFTINDFLRFGTHYLFHKYRFLWRFHQVHHSAEVLTPLTLYRLHPVEMIAGNFRNALSYGLSAGFSLTMFGNMIYGYQILGVSALGFLFNIFAANLRHSPIPVSFGWLEWLFISPRQHQLHHDRKGARYNYGVCLAIWDHLFRSWRQPANDHNYEFGIGKPQQHTIVEQFFGKKSWFDWIETDKPNKAYNQEPSPLHCYLEKLKFLPRTGLSESGLNANNQMFQNAMPDNSINAVKASICTRHTVSKNEKRPLRL